MAMLYLGYPSNSVDLKQLRDVETLIKAVRPYVTYFSSTKMLLDLPSEEVCIAMSWSGDYSVATNRAKEAGIDIKLDYIIPCLLYTSPSPRDRSLSRMPSSA